MNSICKICGAVDSRIADPKWGAEGCTECYSVEQGFLYVSEYEDYNGLVIDEDGNIYVENHELDGPISCEWSKL